MDLKQGRRSILSIACRYGQDEVVQLLIAQGAPISAQELEDAVKSGGEVLVKRLLENGADVNETNIQTWTPLLRAVKSGNCSVTRLLLDKGADITAMPHYNYTGDSGGYSLYDSATPLHIATYKGNLEMVQLLLDNGADVKAGCDSRQTPLDWAIEYYHDEIVKLFVEKERGIAGVAARRWAWRDVLHQASLYGHMNVALRMLNKGADINAKDERGMTALYAAGRYGNVEATQLLLNHGADVNAKDNSGRNSSTPCTHAWGRVKGGTAANRVRRRCQCER